MNNLQLDTSLNKAYEILAKELLEFIGNNNWDKAVSKYEIFSKMISKERSFFIDNKEIWDGEEISKEVRTNASNAAYYIKDFLIENQGDRIWGLTFTLYPNGKFEIEFDYNKPEGYEETDEVITGEEINRTFLK
ncbi:hypothetical protein GCM10010099_19580 [Streptomyces cinereus]|nr:hypothetical protein GCM10010099_19580 [Streptomyces cinereus]